MNQIKSTNKRKRQALPHKQAYAFLENKTDGFDLKIDNVVLANVEFYEHIRLGQCSAFR